MKKIATILLILVLTFTAHAARDHQPPSEYAAGAVPIAPDKPQPTKPHSEPSQTPKPAQDTPQSVAAPKPETCRSAIAKVWPAELQARAIIVMTHENRLERPDAIGEVNPDAVRSRDFGCFQINNHWHPGYFSDGDWRDPVWAAKYALKIYRERQATNGNGWSAWYAVRGILW